MFLHRVFDLFANANMSFRAEQDRFLKEEILPLFTENCALRIQFRLLLEDWAITKTVIKDFEYFENLYLKDLPKIESLENYLLIRKTRKTLSQNLLDDSNVFFSMSDVKDHLDMLTSFENFTPYKHRALNVRQKEQIADLSANLNKFAEIPDLIYRRYLAHFERHLNLPKPILPVVPRESNSMECLLAYIDYAHHLEVYSSEIVKDEEEEAKKKIDFLRILQDAMKEEAEYQKRLEYERLKCRNEELDAQNAALKKKLAEMDMKLYHATQSHRASGSSF